MLCSPTQTCFWAGRLTPAIRAMRDLQLVWRPDQIRPNTALWISELEILTKSRVTRKPMDAETSGTPAWGVCPCSGDKPSPAFDPERASGRPALLMRGDWLLLTRARDRRTSRPSVLLRLKRGGLCVTWSPAGQAARAPLQIRLLQQALVLVRHQVRLDLRDEIHHHHAHDQQRGA